MLTTDEAKEALGALAGECANCSIVQGMRIVRDMYAPPGTMYYYNPKYSGFGQCPWCGGV